MILRIRHTATMSEYIVNDGSLTEAQAKQLARDAYYYTSYDAKAEKADGWDFAGRTYYGWLVKVNH